MINNPSHKSNGYFIFLSGIFLTFLALAAFTSFYWLAAVPFAVLFFYFAWQEWRFVFFLLIVSLPWSVEYNFTSSLGTDVPDEELMLIMAVLLGAHYFFNPLPASRAWKHPLIYLLLFYFGWIFIAVSFSTDWLISVKFLLAKGWYLAAFVLAPLLIFRNKRSIQATALLFLISMLILVVVVLYRHGNLGFNFANINSAVKPFFRNHVNYSAMLVCTIPVWVAVYELNRKYRRLVIISMFIVLAALFFSYSRGAWMALLIGLIAYWLIHRRRLFSAFVFSILLVVGFTFWMKSNDRYLQYAHDYRTTIFHRDFEEHLVATYKLKDLSTAERFNRWIAGVRMIKDNWLTGYGPNTFYYNYKPYAIPVFKTWVSDNKEHSTVHNYFLLTIIEQGVPGLLFYLLLVGGMLFYAETLYKRIEDKFYKVTAKACGVMIVMIMVVDFLSDLIETDKVGSLFFLCLATLVAADLNTRSVKHIVS